VNNNAKLGTQYATVHACRDHPLYGINHLIKTAAVWSSVQLRLYLWLNWVLLFRIFSPHGAFLEKCKDQMNTWNSKWTCCMTDSTVKLNSARNRHSMVWTIWQYPSLEMSLPQISSMPARNEISTHNMKCRCCEIIQLAIGRDDEIAWTTPQGGSDPGQTLLQGRGENILNAFQFI
jgi:hypothetical protein